MSAALAACPPVRTTPAPPHQPSSRERHRRHGPVGMRTQLVSICSMYASEFALNVET